MPMSKDSENGGTDADGSKNCMYCSYCFKEDVFLFKGTTKEMQAFCKDKLIEKGSSKLLA